MALQDHTNWTIVQLRQLNAILCHEVTNQAKVTALSEDAMMPFLRQ